MHTRPYTVIVYMRRPIFGERWWSTDSEEWSRSLDTLKITHTVSTILLSAPSMVNGHNLPPDKIPLLR